MISQAHCSGATPMGATLAPEGGATFRAWAPRASAVYLNGVFGGLERTGQTPDLLMAKDAQGYWSGFVADAADGDTYRFFVVGVGSTGFKRDPYARELVKDTALPFPVCPAVVRSASAYPWHDAGFRAPEFSDLVVYQLHIGTYAPAAPGIASTFLDLIEKIPYLVALGINAVQPLPVSGNEDIGGSLGYDGSDYFSPELEYVVSDEDALATYLTLINHLLEAKQLAPMTLDQIRPGASQMKAMVDLLHVYGIAVIFDVVYNHAGGWSGTYSVPESVASGGTLHGDDESLYFWDRAAGDNNQSLYFSDKGYVGGLSFALWNADVRGFLLNNAKFYLEEMHGDGFRFDEISNLLGMNGQSGWDFVRQLSDAIRAEHPRALQNAEYWPGEYYGQPIQNVVTPAAAGGMGFDAVQHDGLRNALRNVIAQAAGGAAAPVDMKSLGAAMWPAGLAQSWRALPCIENHDVVKRGEHLRIPALADISNPRSWYARSRTRLAMALLLTAPGIPQLFMGQEFLEDKQWDANPEDPGHMIWWGGLESAALGGTADRAMADHLRFTQDAIRLRMSQPGLRGEGLNVFYTSDADRIIAFQRWVPDEGHDVVVVANLSESTRWGYQVGFPSTGRWLEIFNSDVYDGWVNPICAGNAGRVQAEGPPMHGLQACASVVIPSNGLVAFVKG